MKWVLFLSKNLERGERVDIKLTLENKQLYPAVVNLRQFSNNTDILKFEMSDYMYETTDLSKLYCYAAVGKENEWCRF